MNNETKMQLEKQQNELFELQQHRRAHHALLALAGVVTLITYLAFGGHLHLGNPLYWSSYFDKGYSAIFGFVFYLVIVVLTGVFLAWVKHFAYLHFSKFGKTSSIVFTLIAFALLAEFFSSTANQDSKSEVHLEHNSAYQNIIKKDSSTAVSVDSALAGQIADASFKMERCKRLLAEGSVKDCNNSSARLDALKDQQRMVLEASKSNALAEKKIDNDREDKLKADSYNASIVMLAQFYSSLFGNNYEYYIKAANLTMMLIIAIAFEILHAFLITAKMQMDAQIDGLISSVGKMRDTADRGDYNHYASASRPASAPLFRYQQPDNTSPNQSMNAPVSGFAERVKTAIGDEYLKANAAREQADMTIARTAGNGLDAIIRAATQQPDLADRATTQQPDLADRASHTSPSDLTDRVRSGSINRPTLDHKTAVSMISAQVRSQLDSGKLKPEQRPVEIACMVVNDQLAQIYPMPDLELTLIARSIIDNLTRNIPEPDRPNLTGQVGQVSLGQVGQVGQVDANLTEIEQKLSKSEEEKVRLQAQIEADRKAAEAEKVRLHLRQKLEEAKAAEAAAAAKAEADRAQKARAAAAAKAEAEAKSRAEAEAEAAERGKLTEEQINIAATVIADAVKAGQVDTLGFSNLAPLIKAAGLPKSSDTVRTLIKLGCKQLTGAGLVKKNPNAGNGKPDFIIA